MSIAIPLAIAASMSVGLLSLSINPRRALNQLFFILTILISLTLFSIITAKNQGSAFQQGLISDPLKWIRASAALKFLILAPLLLSIKAIETPDNAIIALIKSNLISILIPTTLSITAFFDSYIPKNSLPGNISFGFLYTPINFIFILFLLFISISPIIKSFRTQGSKKHQFFIFSFTVFFYASAIYAPFFIGHLLGIAYLKELAIIASFIGFIFLSFLLFIPKIISLAVALKAFFLHFFITFLIFLVIFFLTSLNEAGFPLFLSSFITTTIYRITTDFYRSRKISERDTATLPLFRSYLNAIKSDDPRSRSVERCAEDAVCYAISAKFSVLALQYKACYHSARFVIHEHDSIFQELKSIGWATPESIERRQPSANSALLANFLQSHRLGALICVPAGSQEPRLLLGVGVRRNEDPYTYADIVQLQHVGDLIDNLLIRSQLAAQSELSDRMEKLAIISRGLAHDLKNLTTPVATFLNHSAFRHPAQSTEAQVHNSASRALGVINDYIDDALFFTENRQLRLSPTNGAEILSLVADLARDRARGRHVRLMVNCVDGTPSPADAVLLQRLLSNLVNNAIDASAPGSVVTLSGGSLPAGGFLFEVADEGCGIPPENLNRIFEPYFTTKVYGTSSRGFGLGLTISQKVAELHRGEIKVNSRVGRGTEVRITIPRLAPAI